MKLSPPFRRATPADAPALADFITWASGGMAPYLWAKWAGPDGDPRAFGEARMETKAPAWIVGEADGHVVAGMTGYVIPPNPDPIPDDMEPMFRPLAELEHMAAGSWYLNVLGAMPAERDKGWGTRLMAIAEDVARAEACTGLSIIVADNNTGAWRLYDRCGYAETARRAMVTNGWQSDGKTWVLLEKRF